MLFTFPSRYWYAIGQTDILRLTQRSGRIHTGFHGARATWDASPEDGACSATGPSPSAAGNSIPFASHAVFCNSRRARRNPDECSPNTPRATPDGYHTRKVWPDPLSLATTHGVSFPAGTEMFHFPAYPPHKAVPAHDGRRVSPFGNPRIKAHLAAPRGLSQPVTSFIGPVCQGIHHTPLQATPARSRDSKQEERQSPDDKSSHSTITKRSTNQPETPTRGAAGEITARTTKILARVHYPVLKPPRDARQPPGPKTSQETDAPAPKPPKADGPGTQKHAHTTTSQRSLPHQQAIPARHHAGPPERPKENSVERR